LIVIFCFAASFLVTCEASSDVIDELTADSAAAFFFFTIPISLCL
jgi:hypothetical protein